MRKITVVVEVDREITADQAASLVFWARRAYVGDHVAGAGGATIIAIEQVATAPRPSVTVTDGPRGVWARITGRR